jgi:hypothetical protein
VHGQWRITNIDVRDEFIYVLKRTPMLVTDAGETQLSPGVCAGFPVNNRVQQDHRGIKGRCRPMVGFKSVPSAK